MRRVSSRVIRRKNNTHTYKPIRNEKEQKRESFRVYDRKLTLKLTFTFSRVMLPYGCFFFYFLCVFVNILFRSSVVFLLAYIHLFIAFDYIWLLSSAIFHSKRMIFSFIARTLILCIQHTHNVWMVFLLTIVRVSGQIKQKLSSHSPSFMLAQQKPTFCRTFNFCTVSWYLTWRSSSTCMACGSHELWANRWQAEFYTR